MKRLFFSLVFIFAAFVFSVSAQTNLVKTNFESGLISAKKSEFETALRQFRASLDLLEAETTPKVFRAKIHFNIGVCLYRTKNQVAAVSEFERAIALDPNYEKAFYALGMAEFELGKMDESERAFLGAIRLNKRNGETWFDLAFVYLARRNYEAAQIAFEKSVAYKTASSAVGHNNLGVIFALGGDYAAAIRQFQKAISESNGQLEISKQNLQSCKIMKQNSGKDLIAKLEFGK